MFRLSVASVVSVLLLSLVLPAAAQGAAKVRGWIFLDDDADYIRGALPKVKAMGINHVEFSHDIVMRAEQVIYHPDRAKMLRELTKLYKKNGIETFIWTHEFEGVPKEFMKGEKVDLNNPRIWDWMGEKYRLLFRTLPDLDGIVLTMSETWKSPIDDRNFETTLNRSQRITKLVTTIHDAIKPMGKKVWVRTWGNLSSAGMRQILPEIQEGIENCPPDVAVHNKHTAGDFYFLTRSPLLGTFKGRDEIVEFDPAGEFHGQAVVPWCAPEYYKSEWDYALSKGAVGAVARLDRMANNALGTPNEVTIYALSRYLRDPSATPDQCWKEWAEERFGKDAAPAVISSLKKTDEIITKTFFTFRCYWMQDHSNVPDYAYSPGHLRGKSAAGIDDQLAAGEPKLLNPTPESLKEMLAEKDRALSLCREAVAEVDAAEDNFRPGDFLWLKTYLERELLLVKVYRSLNEIYFRTELLKKGEGDKASWEASMQEALSLASYIEKRYGPNVRLVGTFKPRGFIVQRIREFVEEAKGRVTSDQWAHDRPDMLSVAEAPDQDRMSRERRSATACHGPSQPCNSTTVSS